MSNTLKLGNGKWATGKDTLLAYNDENNNFKPLPFSFSRASSGTVVNEQGLIELVGSDEPRIDFKDDAKGSLLLEPTRSNLFPYSENFNNWSKSGWTLTSGLLAPNGSLDAYSVLRTTGSTFAQSSTLLSNTTYTFSAYIKNVNATNIQLRVQNQAGNTIGTESNCIVFSVTEQTNDSNFTRITHTFNTGDTGSYGLFLGYYSAGEYIVYGAQLEQGSYATSYIPTNGSAVTRVAESSSQTVPDGVIGQTEGTMFVDCKINAQGTYTGFSLSDGTTNNEVIVRFTTTDRIEYYLRSGGSQPFGGGTTDFDTDSIVKVALAYKSGDSVFYVNGIEVASSTNTTIPLNLSKVKFSRGNSTAVFSGKTNNFKIYNTRLSNAELQALTTI